MRRLIYRFVVLLLLITVFSYSSLTIGERPSVLNETITGVTTYSPIIKKTAPAVVSIMAIQVVNQPTAHPLTQDPHFSDFFGRFGGLPKKLERSLGSGVIIDSEGFVVTCLHVIRNARDIMVKMADNREFKAEIVARDPNNDLAILRIKSNTPGEKFPTIHLGSTEKLEVGDVVLAIGNPFGIGQTVTSGIISGLARKVNSHLLIQCDASINPGNSGGALVDLKGELVAIPNAILSKTGASHGIGFAIPVGLVKNVMQAARNGGKLIYAWSGIDVQEVTSPIASSLNLAKPGGVLVTSIHIGSPAVGLKQGDLITEINGRVINTDEDFIYAMQTLHLGEQVALKVLQQGKSIQIKYLPIAPPELPAPQKTKFEGKSPLTGILIANLSPALAMENGLPDSQAGVVILEGGTGILSRTIGIQRGDILKSINDIPVRSVDDVKAMLQAVRAPLNMEISRGREVVKITLK